MEGLAKGADRRLDKIFWKGARIGSISFLLLLFTHIYISPIHSHTHTHTHSLSLSYIGIKNFVVQQIIKLSSDYATLDVSHNTTEHMDVRVFVWIGTQSSALSSLSILLGAETHSRQAQHGSRAGQSLLFTQHCATLLLTPLSSDRF